jgi:hypothetical protein
MPRGARRHTYLPDAEETDEKVVGEAVAEHLRDDKHVAGEGPLQHDGHVGGVEELDAVTPALPPEAVALDGDLDVESLEVDDDGERGSWRRGS